MDRPNLTRIFKKLGPLDNTRKEKLFGSIKIREFVVVGP